MWCPIKLYTKPNAWRHEHLEIRIDLQSANLRGADLSTAYLSRANLSEANLTKANLSWANLTKANLRGVDFSGANLRGVDFSGADLQGAIFAGADLSGADLTGTIRSEVTLTGATLTGATLSGVDFSRQDFSGRDLSGLDFTKANFREATLSGVDLTKATLSGADLSGAILTGANFSETNLSKGKLIAANLTKANLTKANLTKANLRGVDLSWAILSGANFRGVDLREVDLSKTNLREATLSGVDLSRRDLSGADLSGANLTGVDFREANLIETNVNGATLTDAWLWETQRAGWSIQGIVCEAVYWDKDRKERTTYSPGEFERLYADKTKIVLHYEGGISPIEVATLPALIQRIEATHPGCILRLQSVQEAPSGATVTLVVEDTGDHNPDELRTLKADIEIVSQRVIRYQRALLEERGTREQLESELQIVYNKIVPQIMRQTMGKSPSIQITGGTIYGNIVGDVSGANAQVHYTHNDLAALEALVREVSSHSTELPLTSAERAQFEEKLDAIQEQLAAQAPNHSILREALHSVRHILEAGVAHVLVGQWLPLLHKLG